MLINEIKIEKEKKMNTSEIFSMLVMRHLNTKRRRDARRGASEEDVSLARY